MTAASNRERFKIARLSGGTTDEEQVRALVNVFRVVASPGYPFPEAWVRSAAEISHARAPRDTSTAQRQIAAGRAHRTPPLETITAPTLVISGEDDPLIKWRTGKDTADRIAGARFILCPGMGHHLPDELVPQIVEEISRTALGRG